MNYKDFFSSRNNEFIIFSAHSLFTAAASLMDYECCTRITTFEKDKKGEKKTEQTIACNNPNCPAKKHGFD